MGKYNTIVINFFGGPGSGKTTCALEVTSELRKKGIEAEFVGEVAKELIYDGKEKLLDGSFVNEVSILAEKFRRINRMYGQVDVIVTDAPIRQSIIYSKENLETLNTISDFLSEKFNNFNFFVERGNNQYQNRGRIHSYKESLRIDGELKEYLTDKCITFTPIRYSDVLTIAQNIIPMLIHEANNQFTLKGDDIDIEMITKNKFMYGSKETNENELDKEEHCIDEDEWELEI